MKIVGINSSSHIMGMEPLAGKSHYYGGDKSEWRTRVPTFAKVKYENAYPGISLIYYGNRQQLEYDFELRPGADPKRIRLRFEGARRLSINEQGALVAATRSGEVRQQKPFAYQQENGEKREVACRFVLKGSREVGFEVGRYDKRKPLIIDPVLSYSTLLGGSNSDDARDIAVDLQGQIYVTGSTASEDFPRGPNSLELGGRTGLYVMKLNADGNSIIYSVFILGGRSEGITIDPQGSAYLTGNITFATFPLTPGAINSSLPFGIFVTKISPAGDALLYSGHLGPGAASDIAADAQGNAYVTGSTISLEFPTTPGAFQDGKTQSFCGRGDTFAMCEDAFISKLNSTGTALVYSTYLGSRGDDVGTGIAVDARGSAYVSGYTTGDFAGTAGAIQPARSGSFDAFVAKMNPTGTALEYFTHLGGRNVDRALDIDIDSDANAYVTGETASPDFPVTEGAFQTSYNSSPAYKSTDSGATWKEIGNGLNAASVLSLAVDPVTPSTVYAGTDLNIFKSTDGGASWSIVNNGLPFLTARAIAIDPRNPSTVYAGGIGWLFKSNNGGNNWMRSDHDIGGFTFNAIVINPKNTATLYASTGGFTIPGVSPGFVYRSTNGGATWRNTDIFPGMNLGIVPALAIDRKKPSKLYAGVIPLFVSPFTGIYRGVRRANKWKSTPVNGNISALAIDPKDTSVVYAGGFELFKNTKRGAGDWQMIGAGLPPANPQLSFPALKVQALAIDPQATSTIYSGSTTGLFKSTDGGLNFRPTDLINVSVNTIAVDPLSPSTLYAGATLSRDAFVAKLNPSGTALVYSSYLGGVASDTAVSISVDAAGSAHIAGQTLSADFPVKDAFQSLRPTGGMIEDAFVAKLSVTGSELVYSSYLGGAARDVVRAIFVGASGDAYVVGESFSADFPIAGALVPVRRGPSDGFIVRITDSGSGARLFDTSESFKSFARLMGRRAMLSRSILSRSGLAAAR